MSHCNSLLEKQLEQLQIQLTHSQNMEARYRLLLETAPDAIVVVDYQGKIVLANAQTETLFGYSRDELLGQTIELLVPNKQRQRHQEHRAHFFSHHSVRPMGSGLDLTARCKNGNEVPVEISLSPLQTTEGLLVSAAIRDISERRSVQEDLRQARDELELRVQERTQDLERANQALQAEMSDRQKAEKALYQAQKMEAVGQLTGGVAHDFNNLLTVISGNLQILSKHCKDDPLTQELIQAVLKAARRGAELNRTLLAFSRRQRLVPELINLNELVHGMEAMLRRSLGETIQIKIISVPDLPTALADPAQLEAALLNLAVNARDAMPDGGQLSIETGFSSLDSHAAALEGDIAPGDYLILAVSDTGTGMLPEVQARAFEPFFTTKETGKGSGLGLAMVYGFAKQSGGHVKIYSEPGHGTTIRLFLPQVQGEEEETDVGIVSGEIIGGHETILVVEDEADVRAMACRVLRSAGYQVLEAGNGTEALAILEKESNIDMLFTDVVLPGGMCGPDIAERVHQIYPGLPVLYTSGYTGNAIQELALLQHEVALLTKPYAIDDLIQQIRQALDKPKSIPK